MPTLYERLGGVYSIATVIDDFIDRVMQDPRLNANPLLTRPTIVFHPLASSILPRSWSAKRPAARRSTQGAR